MRFHSHVANRVEHRRPGAILGHAREQSTAADSAAEGRRLTGKPATESNLSLRAPAQRVAVRSDFQAFALIRCGHP